MAKRRRDSSERFRHAVGVEAREVEGEFFLATPSPGTIHHLDQMASVAWRALAEPKSAEEMIGLFQAGFPDTPRRRIAKDIAGLLAFFEERGLIVRTSRK